MATVHLTDDLLSEIFLRLPAKSLLRFRAVSTSISRLTSSPSFLLSHHLLRPPLLLLDRHALLGGRGGLHHYTLSTAHHAQNQLHPLLEYRSLDRALPLDVVAACSGVLLLHLHSSDHYIASNPSSRHYAPLPPPPPSRDHTPLAFYFHPSSGEFRLLLAAGAAGGDSSYHILATGADAPRRIDLPAGGSLAVGLPSCSLSPPVPLRGALHWPPVTDGVIVVFDVESEEFRPMPAPRCADGGRICLFDMEGTIGLSIDRPPALGFELWVLQDYDAGVWRCDSRMGERARKRFLGKDCFGALALSEDGDLMLESRTELAVVDTRGRAPARVTAFDHCWIRRHLFKESLVPHKFFRRYGADDACRYLVAEINRSFADFAGIESNT